MPDTRPGANPAALHGIRGTIPPAHARGSIRMTARHASC